MTLSSRHRIRNSSPGGLRPSTLHLGHGGSTQYWLSHVDGEETFFVSFKTPRPGTEPRALAWKAAVLTTNLGPPPLGWLNFCVSHKCYGPTRAKVPVLAMKKTCSGGDRCRYRTCCLKRKHRRDVLTNLRGIVGEVLAKFRRIFSDT